MDTQRAMPDIESFSRDAAVLSQALPYMQKYEGKTVVVKYGGHAMGELSLGQGFARDIALQLGQRGDVGERLVQSRLILADNHDRDHRWNTSELPFV